LTGGQEAECKQAIPLLENVKTLAVIEEIDCDYWQYKERHVDMFTGTIH